MAVQLEDARPYLGRGITPIPDGRLLVMQGNMRGSEEAVTKFLRVLAQKVGHQGRTSNANYARYNVDVFERFGWDGYRNSNGFCHGCLL
jgi:hypothetical protein